MTELDPLQTAAHIRDTYLRYLRTTFPLQDPTLSGAYQVALSAASEQLIKGPLLEAQPPYRTGCSLADLVGEGVLHPDMVRLNGEALPAHRPLYRHQERAIRHVVSERRNTVIATGTGSGKTESFLLPILDHLMREQAASTLAQPGVRALLLYPMNALANDQLRRLRALLANVPEITFGRYTGETLDRRAAAEEELRQRFPSDRLLPNHLLSREEIRDAPPHILMTNYAMLEYLLMRPDDTTLFDGDTGRHWCFLVLDEVHVYRGATGIEIGMLMRRLKDRVTSGTRRLRCLATSATLGRGEQDFPAAAKFATDLFDEPFEYLQGDADRRDVVQAERMPLASEAECWGEISPASYAAFQDGAASPLALLDAAACAEVPEPVLAEARAHLLDADASNAVLHALLSGDARLDRLRRRLSEGPALLANLAREIFPEQARPEATLVQLASLAVRARPVLESAALLPARYHMFVRALEGAFVCLRDHEGQPAIYLERRHDCPRCSTMGRSGAVFELAVCNRCGQAYAVGASDVDSATGIPRLMTSGTNLRADGGPGDNRPGETLLYAMLSAASIAVDEDEADGDDEVTTEEDETDRRVLCTSCRALLLPGETAFGCGCPDAPDRLRPVVLEPSGIGRQGLRACGGCGARAGTGEVIFRFLPGQDAPVSVLATALYEQLPDGADGLPGRGRKLLSFADSRQDAAFFASYLEQTYQQILRRRLVLQALTSAPDVRGGEYRIDLDLANLLLPFAREAGMFATSDAPPARRRKMLTWLMQEFVTWDRRIGLEGLGLLHFRLVRPERWTPPPPLLNPPWSLTPDEAWSLIAMLLTTLRQQQAVTFPDGVSSEDEAFAPRTRAFWVRSEQSNTKAGIYAWMPGRHSSNRRMDILARLLAQRSPEMDETERKRIAAETLQGLWKHLTAPAGPWQEHLPSQSIAREGVVWQLSHAFWEVVPTTPEAAVSWWRCERCQNLTPYNVHGVCPLNRCSGRLAAVALDSPSLNDHHYRRLYRAMRPVALSAEEHTAQWTPAEAANIQARFTNGDVNVLSCSTTFELGVDVGELQAVLMRNVPPTTANYVQRAGRAGRRTDSTAFVLTYAQRRSHDFTHFRDPVQLVAGRVSPPVLSMTNVPIVRRHMHAVLLAAFLRAEVDRDGSRYRTVGAFFEGEPSGERRFAEFAAGHSVGVAQALDRIVPPEVRPELEPTGWTWVEELYRGEDDGLMPRVAADVRTDLEEFGNLRDQAYNERRGRDGDMYDGILRTQRGRELLGFLGSQGVLPKYGFPVDVVPLRTEHVPERASRRLDLTRDLRVAIGEYAPGSQVVAAKRIWVSGGLHRLPGKEWPRYIYAVCRSCGRFQRQVEPGITSCGACGEHLSRGRSSGTLIKPLFGFVCEPREPRPSGEARPARAYASRVYFSAFEEAHGASPGSARAAGFPAGAPPLEIRYSRYGRLAVVNSGPNGRGYRICESCGFGEPAPTAERTARSAPKERSEHMHPRRGRSCSGRLVPTDLGHDFITDILELRWSGGSTAGMTVSQWRSVLYSLLEGASRTLDIERGDIDGTLYRYGRDAPPALVLFDDVPGGAGHCRRIAEALPASIAAALAHVEGCSCGAETSCYECLRNFRNQIFHEELVRCDAATFLRTAVGEPH